MHKALERFVYDNVKSLNTSEIEEICSIFKFKNYRRKEYIKTPFAAGKEVVFIAKGAVRVFVYSNEGDETTVRIREENVLIADPFRLLKNNSMTPISVGIECLEDVDALVCPNEDFESLRDSNLSLNILIRQHLTQQIIQVGKQLLLFLTGDASDSYQYILNEQPNLIRNFPLHFVASMIGITPTQLSRVRNKTME